MPSLSLETTLLYYRLEGGRDRPRLLLVHPVGADHSLFDAVVPSLLQHYQVLRPDLRGHGGSSTPAAQAYRLDDLADDVLALCDQLGWQRFVVCGVSLGAMTAMQMALRTTGRIEALVICSAAARMHEPPGGGWDARIAGARAHGIAGNAAGMVERMFSPEFRATEPPVIGTFVSVFEHTDPFGFASCLAVLRDTDLRPKLPEIDVPAMVVSGSKDPLIPLTDAQTLVEGLPRARHVVLDAGHFPLIEAPQTFVEAVRAFLRSELGHPGDQ